MEILTNRQISFLKLFAQNEDLLKNFYLTDRFSEDLDFFSEHEVDPLSIDVFLQSIKKHLGFTSIDSQTKMNRNLFSLHCEDEVLKTEFTYFPFPRIKKGSSHYGVTTDDIFDIAVNKLFSIYQRSVQRDYIDLYMICKKEHYTISDLIKSAKIKFDWHIDPLQLANQFLKSQEATDPPRLIIGLKRTSWLLFFKNEALKLKGDIVGK